MARRDTNGFKVPSSYPMLAYVAAARRQGVEHASLDHADGVYPEDEATLVAGFAFLVGERCFGGLTGSYRDAQTLLDGWPALRAAFLAAYRGELVPAARMVG